MKEIGGEFSSRIINTENRKRKKNVIDSKSDLQFTASGRTSIDIVIRDILSSSSPRVAWLPSYCCDSMISPFLRNGLIVRFYDVVFSNNMLKPNLEECDIQDGEIVLSLDYFGYFRNNFGNIADKIKSKVIYIDDRTHSIFCKHDLNTTIPLLDNTLTGKKADYIIASLRKWTFFAGCSIAFKRNGKFSVLPQKKQYEATDLRKKAAALKQGYLRGTKISKSKFLNLFGEAENILDSDFEYYSAKTDEIDYFINRIDVSLIQKKRRENAEILIDGINDIKEISIIFNNIDDSDCPLFVPIMVPRDIRESLRDYLVSKQIYCPIHWPISSLHEQDKCLNSNLYMNMLSLVCDQRYDEKDMDRIIKEIHNFFRGI